MLSDKLLLECPRGLDGVEVRRVGRLVDDAYAASGAGGHDARVVVSPEIVHDEDVARAELRQKLLLKPRDEPVAIRSLPNGGQHDPAATPDGAEQRQVGATVHGNPVDELFAPPHPGVTSAHCHAEPGFVEEDEALNGHAADLPEEGGSAFNDVGTKTLQRPSALFFTTYPWRCSARFMLDT
jgi:hypothetical protein